MQWDILIVKPKRPDLPQKAGGIFYFHFLISLTICSSVSSEIDSGDGLSIMSTNRGIDAFPHSIVIIIHMLVNQAAFCLIQLRRIDGR